MRQNPVQNFHLLARLGTLLVILLPSIGTAQTVGDTFIDTSEFVQSSSPIRDNGVVQGYITETIVRGYRGPNYDRYYGNNTYNSAIEFSTAQKIQPVVYENSAPNQPTSLEPPLRPTPDPGVQAANNGQWNQGNVVSQGTFQPQINQPRGFASQASYQQPAAGYAGTQTNMQTASAASYSGTAPPMNTPGRLVHPPYAATTTSSPYPAQPYSNQAPNYTANSYPVNMPNQSGYAPAQYSTPPAAYTSALTNCCDPVYATTQFVTPNVNSGAGTLRTYPQYGGNPYPRQGFGISQPYVRDTWVPMIPLRSMPYGTYLGQGIIGQPVAYVDGEPVRNFLRYVFP